MSATATIFAGTWRGEAPARIFDLDRRRRSASSSVTPSRKPHEQHDAHVVVEILADGERLQHLRHALDLRIDLRRADPHAAGIERRVGAAVDDDAAMLGPFGEIAVRPDAGKALEIGGAVFRAVRDRSRT